MAILQFMNHKPAKIHQVLCEPVCTHPEVWMDNTTGEEEWESYLGS